MRKKSATSDSANAGSIFFTSLFGTSNNNNSCSYIATATEHYCLQELRTAALTPPTYPALTIVVTIDIHITTSSQV